MFIFLLFVISVNLTVFVNCINFDCAMKFVYCFISHVNSRLVSTMYELRILWIL
jgi:hypothetical protein